MAMVDSFLATYRQAYGSSPLPVPKVSSHLMLFCIHRVNRVNSRNDSESCCQHHKHCPGIIARDSIYAIARICYRRSVSPSVCPSVTRVDQSKMLEVRIMQLSPPASPMTLSFLTVNFTPKFQGELRERVRQIREG